MALSYILDDDNLFNRIEVLENVSRQRVFRVRRNYIQEFDDCDFKRRFRLSKESVLNVLALIENKLEFPSNRNKSVSPIQQLLLTLRYYATGSQHITMADFSGVSVSTANRIIHKVTHTIASLRKQFIKFPDRIEELERAQREFYNIAKFPKVLGALDCTHVRIRSPGGNQGEFFRNRKGYMSMNVQVICDANLIFTDIVARWPGSSQDQTIWNSSYRNALFESGKYGDNVLLADSGYMNQPYIMMPLNNPSTRAEILYNESQIRSRNPIERAFGVWKRRFPILALGIQMKIENCLPVIVATGVLHNILRKANEELPLDIDIQLPAPWEQLLSAGTIREHRIQNTNDINPVRRSLINNYFNSL